MEDESGPDKAKDLIRASTGRWRTDRGAILSALTSLSPSEMAELSADGSIIRVLNDEPSATDRALVSVQLVRGQVGTMARTDLATIIAAPARHNLGTLAAAYAREELLAHHEAFDRTGTGTVHGNQCGLPKPAGAKLTDCTTYALDVLEKAYAAKRQQTLWNKILTEAKKQSGGHLKGTEVLKALQSVSGWEAVFWAPDPRNPQDGQSEHPFAYKKVREHGSYYGITVDRSRSVVNYRRTNRAHATDETGIAHLRGLQFGVLATRGGIHMAVIVNGYVHEVHWDKPATDRNAIGATPLELFAWQSGVIAAPATDLGRAWNATQTVEQAAGHGETPATLGKGGGSHRWAKVTVPDWANAISPFPTKPVLDFTTGDAKLTTAFATVTANNPTNLCVALVDVTGNPAKPPYAGSNDQEILFPGSMMKIGAMYAAFALKKQVQAFLDAAAANSASTAAADIFPIISAAWRPRLKKLFPSRPEKPFNLSQDIVEPQLGTIFDVAAGKVSFKSSPSTTDKDIDFDGDHSAPGRFAEWLRSMTRWSSNLAASKVVDALGYFYINGALADAGFFEQSSTTGGKGLWLSADFQRHDWVRTADQKRANAAGPKLTKRWADAQADIAGPRVRSNITATAFQTAKLMTLMATDNLVDPDSSQKMRTLLAGAILHIATSSRNNDGIGSYFQDALRGDGRTFDAVQAKKGFGDDRFSHECGIIERTVGGKTLRYVAVVLGSAPSQGRADFSTMAVRLDDAIIARNR